MKKAIIVLAIVSMISSLASAQLAGYWKFDETSGSTVLDSSGNGKNGTLYSENSSNYPTRISGVNGNALLFNANTTDSSNYNKVIVPLSSSDALANLGEAFTISMWVRRDGVGGVSVQPGMVCTDAYEIDLATDPNATESTDGQDTFWSDASTNWQWLWLGYSTTEQKTLGTWYLLTITYDGNYLRKYVNGEMVGGIAAPTSFSLTATTALSIAARSSNGYFIGAIDDLAIWSGKYLSSAEVAKLANGTTTPLTATESNPTDPMPSNYFVKENNDGYSWLSGGWTLFWDPSFCWDASISADNKITAWWLSGQTLTMPGSRVSVYDYCKFRARDLADYDTHPSMDVTKYGIEWIDPAWSGRNSNVAVLAAYITPGIALCQETYGRGYQEYNPAYSWTKKDFFKSYMRVATVNGAGAWLRVRVYTYTVGTYTPTSDMLTLLGEVYWPVGYKGDYVWQELKYAFPKPTVGTPYLWIETSIVGGSSNTRVYIDEFKPISDQANTDQHIASYLKGDLNKDAIVNYDDIWDFGSAWLDTISGASIVEPRSGGLLTNGDFSSDAAKVMSAFDVKVAGNPTGWTFTGSGNYGVADTSKRGRLGWYYSMTNQHPVGGNVSAYTTDMFAGDPNGALEQTASAPAVAGQTYYAMGYVMTYDYTSNGDGDWYGWRDTATMDILIDGVVKQTVSRRLSRSIWRPIYASYTATSADAGKAIKIRFSYANTYTSSFTQSGTMYIGYAYLGTTKPNEWPEKRTNLLANGGFEDLSAVEAYNSSYADALRASDNTGTWFVSGMPNIFPNWIYEVPSDYDLNNQGGIRSSAYYASPVPSPGMNDIVAYGSGTMVYGQIVGALTAGTTYYLDTACGVLVEPQTWGTVSVTWPNPAPRLHIELWRIPSGVTDPAVIRTGITTNQSGYVKLAEANEIAAGDVKSINKWQIIGTSYTATSSDTNVYVRVYGTNPITSGTTYPHFVFSDVYLSTQKRLIAGGTLINNIASGVQYDLLGPYNCYQASLMGFTAPPEDLSGDCTVNLVDYALMADNWVKNWYTNITGTTPWN